MIKIKIVLTRKTEETLAFSNKQYRINFVSRKVINNMIAHFMGAFSGTKITQIVVFSSTSYNNT